MKHCKSCNMTLPHQNEFCPNCGGRVDIIEQAVVTNEASRQKKKRLKPIVLIGIILLLAAGIVALVFLLKKPILKIQGYYPMAGAKGSYVLIELDKTIKDEEIHILYDSKEVLAYQVSDKVIGFNVPLDAESAFISVSYKGKQSRAAFTVFEETFIEQYEGKLYTSSSMQTIKSDENISVTLPENFLTSDKQLAISRVEYPSVIMESPISLTDVYDISIEGLTALNEYIEIGLPYDPDWFDKDEAIADYVEPLRWDSENKVWVELCYRVDEDNHMVYFVTDHLSFFTLSVKSLTFKGLAEAGITAGAVLYGSEWLANDVYISTQGNVRILYSKKALSNVFPDDEWKKVMANGDLSIATGYNNRYPSVVQDVGYILEESLKAYTNAGFDDPTANRWGGHYFTRRIKVKIDSYWNYYGAGEFEFNAFWDQINIPSDIIKNEVFNLVRENASYYKDAEMFLTQTLAHELFHAIQRPYYGSLTDFSKGKHLWWIEACAEYAANDIAWNRKGTVLNTRIGNSFFEYALNSTGKKAGSYAGDVLDYEYLSSVFVRFLVEKFNCNLKDLMGYVAAPGMNEEPFDAILSYAIDEAGYEFDDQLLYTDFVLWLLNNGNFTMSDFEDNMDSVAENEQTIAIAGDHTMLTIQKQEQNVGVVVILKANSDGAGMSYVDLIWEPSMELDIEVNEGDVYYVIAPNMSGINRSLTTSVRLKNSEATELLAEHSFNVAGSGTAKIWAFKVGNSSFSIDPSEIEDAQFNTEYDFIIKGDNISDKINEVRIEYDFGDGSKIAKGVITAPVTDGSIDATLKYAYEPKIEAASDKAVIYTVKAVIYNGDQQIGSVTSALSFEPVSVVIQAPRIVTYEFTEGATEVEHTFEAYAKPNGEYKFVWDFGDGSAPYQATGSESVVTHTYNQIGTFTPTVTLYDLNDTHFTSDTVSITITSQAQAQDLNGNYAGKWTSRQIDGDFNTTFIESEVVYKPFDMVINDNQMHIVFNGHPYIKDELDDSLTNYDFLLADIELSEQDNVLTGVLQKIWQSDADVSIDSYSPVIHFEIVDNTTIVGYLSKPNNEHKIWFYGTKIS